MIKTHNNQSSVFIKRVADLRSLENLGATQFAKNIAIEKSNVLIFEIYALKLPAAHILKQEAISVGGDFISSKEMILCQSEAYDGILITTKKQLSILTQKLSIQPFGLQKIAKILESHAKNCQDLVHFKKPQKPQIMGIINITNDSFYADSRVKNIDEILRRVENMIANGASIIDIGGASSRPGSAIVESSVELNNIKEAILALDSSGLVRKATFSIDSYNYETLRFCVERGFSVINDINGLRDRRIMELGSEFGTKIVLMFNNWLTPCSGDIVAFVDNFFAEKLEALESCGVKKSDVILDIGFGFGVDLGQNVELVRAIRHFLHFGCEILVGASRKRGIGEVTGAEVQDRLSGTLALHQIAIQNGASIIRCHDVLEHKNMIDILEVFK